jgi:hypothetical protein
MTKSGRHRCARHVARNGGKRSACNVIVGKPKRKRPSENSKIRWQNNIIMKTRSSGKN